MYSTVEEIHVAIDILYQQLNSNRKRSYAPEAIDHIYNMKMLEYISTRSNVKTNLKFEGRESTIKRVEDLKSLKARKTLPAYIEDSFLSYVILPSNYREFKDAECNIVYNCRGFSSAVPTSVISIGICILPFLDSDATSDFFSDFEILLSDTVGVISTLFSINNYGNLSNLNSNDIKFEIINLVLDSVILSNKDVEIYWEHYGSEYHAESFIIVDTNNNYDSSTISYDTVTETVNFNPNILNKYDSSSLSNVELISTSSDLVASENISEIKSNTMMMKNRYRSPLIELEDNILLVYNDNKFVVKSILIRYDKKPIFMNYKAKILPSLLDRANEIIKMVVFALSVTTSGSIEGILKETQIIE
jgi:hypothetical protein